MDRNTAQKLRIELNSVFDKYRIAGFDVEVGNCTYGSVEATFKVTIREQGAKSPGQALAERKAKDFGLKLVNAAGDEIVDYKPRSPKYPWIVKRASDGKQYKYPTSMIKAAFGA